MKIDIIFLVILGFMVLRTICNNKTNTKEHMAVSDEIKNEIKAIYNADVTAIQNLSDIANKLQTGGYTCPGDYSVTGKMTVKGALDVVGSISSNTDFVIIGKYALLDICNKVIALETTVAAQDTRLAARLTALEAKTQFITTVASAEPTKTPNTMTLNSQVIIDIPYYGNYGDGNGLVLKNGTEIEIFSQNNVHKGHIFVAGNANLGYWNSRTQAIQAAVAT
jgi:hypothetical protein